MQCECPTRRGKKCSRKAKWRVSGGSLILAMCSQHAGPFSRGNDCRVDEITKSAEAAANNG